MVRAVTSIEYPGHVAEPAINISGTETDMVKRMKEGELLPHRNPENPVKIMFRWMKGEKYEQEEKPPAGIHDDLQPVSVPPGELCEDLPQGHWMGGGQAHQGENDIS